MNIDERLDRLTVRHEALTQTVEVIAGMQRENEKQISGLRVSFASFRTPPRAHDSRLDGHEDGLDKLEGGTQ